MTYLKVSRFGIVFLLFIFSACTHNVEKTNLVSAKTFNYPVLKGKTDNPIIRITVENDSTEKILQSVHLDFGETKPDFIKSIRLFYVGSDSLFSNKNKVAELKDVSGNVIIESNQSLMKGRNYFWVSCELTDKVDLECWLTASLKHIQMDGKRLAPANNEGTRDLRLGVAVRKRHDDNVHTYRIPGLVTTNDGTLLAIYDVRRESGRDLQGHMDIGVSRSIDAGSTWEPMRVALDMGEWGGLPQKFNGVSDANILVDRKSGDIYVAGLWMHGVINAKGIWQENLTEESTVWNHQWRNKGSQSGLGVKETSQFLITKSTDDGKTWGDPINLTEMCKKEEWWLWAPAPGHGITLEDGTLVFPTQGRDETGRPFSNITFSKDGGETWKTSNPASHNTTECMAVQLSNSSIMLNMRDNRNRSEKGEQNGRAIAITKDLGETWIEHETSHGALIESVCMASIHKHNFTDKNGKQKSVLFFSNPNSKYTRHKQTIKVSFDDGLTWPEKYWMELDEGKGAGYSCLTSINENTIGILYEGSQAHMTFQTIDVSGFLKDVK